MESIDLMDWMDFEMDYMNQIIDKIRQMPMSMVIANLIEIYNVDMTDICLATMDERTMLICEASSQHRLDDGIIGSDLIMPWTDQVDYQDTEKIRLDIERHINFKKSKTKRFLRKFLNKGTINGKQAEDQIGNEEEGGDPMWTVKKHWG